MNNPSQPAFGKITIADREFESKYCAVAELLEVAYGPFAPRAERNPLDELMLTILSQHTSDRNSDRAFANLIARYPDWAHVMTAPNTELADVIRVGGLGRVKAERIQAVLREIFDRTGGFDLGFLALMEFDATREWLITLSGVGPKTAACVQLFSLGQPALPVDTHVHRVTTRLGLAPSKASADRVQALLERHVPPQERYAFHVHLIQHGREVCAAQRPLHELCNLQQVCDFWVDAQCGVAAQ